MSEPSLRAPHHDGSVLYVPEQEPSLGETVTLFVRVPHEAGVTAVHVRAVVDAEPEFIEAVVDRRDDVETWWRVEVDLRNPVTSYRFLLDGEHGSARRTYRWLNGTGTHGADVTDADDFRIAIHDAPPSWAQDAVFYQIFPDRFANSGAERDWPDWAIRSGWDDPVLRGGSDAMHQLYGGDFDGIVKRLDHLERLGVDVVYLTPFFPSESNHRYNATSFSRVDPVLGGDEALVRLADALRARGMRLIGDLTLNHSGDRHEWFLAAQADQGSVEAGCYHFHRHPDDYVMWLDVPTLPKFDHRSEELARRLYEGPDSVVAHWLRDPYGLDGWRVDVANMTGRHGDVDVNHRVAHSMRTTMGHVRPDSLLLAEHCHDASRDLLGDGWHGTMFYAGFTRPMWSWLGRPDLDLDFLGLPVPVPRLSGQSIAATMRAFAASVPWRSLAHSMLLLGSHDTSRWRTVTDRRDDALVGAGVLLTYPGIPSIFAGDEIGLEGVDNEDARQPFPWDESLWDAATLARYSELVGLRRASVALRRGGLRWVHVGDDVLVYLREHADERILVHAARADHEPVSLAAHLLGVDGRAERLLGGPDLVDDRGEVRLPGDGPAFHAWRL
jgi:alpha-glucosidase